MDRSLTRYEILRNDDDNHPTTEPATVASTEDIPPPDYAIAITENQATNPVSAAEAKLFEPPSYNVATDLPTYEDAERTKQEELEQERIEGTTGREPLIAPECSDEGPVRGVGDVQLGTDGVFLCTFIISFLFNWIGLLASMCLTQSVAGRFGALSGFGLSLVKWAAIVKQNNWASGFANGNTWVWWLLMALGLLIFLRGCLQYVRVKHQWQNLSVHVRRRIFLYF